VKDIIEEVDWRADDKIESSGKQQEQQQ